MTRKRWLWIGIALVAVVSISQPWLLIFIPAAIHAALAVLSNMLNDFADNFEKSTRDIGLDNPIASFLVHVPAYCLDAMLNAMWMPSSTTRRAMFSMNTTQIVLLRAWNTIEVAAFVFAVYRLARKTQQPVASAAASADVAGKPPL